MSHRCYDEAWCEGCHRETGALWRTSKNGPVRKDDHEWLRVAARYWGHAPRKWGRLPGLHHDTARLWTRASECDEPEDDCDHHRRYRVYTSEALDGQDFPEPWLTSERLPEPLSPEAVALVQAARGASR